MQTEVGQPWFHSAVEHLDPRRKDRLLAVDCTLLEAAALRTLVGSDGAVTFVLRDQATAEKIAERDWVHARVLAHRLDGGETFGTFDALLIAPTVGPLLDVNTYAALVRRNLRPGGRFVVVDFFQPRTLLARFLDRTYNRAVLPVVGGLITGDRSAYQYLAGSMGAWTDREGFERMCTDGGFARAGGRELFPPVASIVIAEKAGGAR